MISELKPYPFARMLFGKFVERHTDQVYGLDRLPLHSQFLIAANHIDFLDGLYLAYWIAGKTYRKIFFFSKTNNYFLFRTTIRVDPKNPSQSLNDAINVLKQGNCVGIFPEGERNTDPVLRPGKTGLARLAMHTRLPLIPVGLIGPAGRTPKESLRLLMSGKSEKLTISIGDPITYWEYYRSDATPEIVDSVTKHIMESIAALTHRQAAA